MQTRIKINWIIVALFITFLVFIGILLWYFLQGNVLNLDQNQLKELFTTGKLPGNSTDEVTKFDSIQIQFFNNTTYIQGFLQIAGKIKHFQATVSGTATGGFFLTEIQPLLEGTDKYQFNPSIVSELVPFWQKFLISIFPLLLLIVASFWLFSKMNKMGAGGGMSPFSMGKSRAKIRTSDTRFTDVAGIKEEKLELEEVVHFLKFPQKYAQMGARVPKGVLLVGPPGTGKTLLAKAVAGEAGVPFFSISGSEFEEVFVGVGASRIREMFTTAKKSAPCIIFIDEIDAVGRKRASVSAATNEQTLNQLLVEMDGFETNLGVIIMAATNRADVLDEALLRPGRFDRQISLSWPDIREREAILRLHARNKNISPKVNFQRIAERTPGFSGAQLENVLNEATLLAVRHNKTVIGLVEIDEAIDRVVGGPAKTSRVITDIDKKIVSYHEAGHALIGLKLEYASKVQKVTIIPRGQAGGYTIMTPKEDTMFYSKVHLKATITGYLGGRASEEIMFGSANVTTGAHDDLEKATTIARRMITEYGMSSELGLVQFENPRDEYSPSFVANKFSDDIASKIDGEIKKLLDTCYVEAVATIKKHKDTLELIAKSLMILETITAEQIEYIDKYNKLPVEVIEMQKEMQKESKNPPKEENEVNDKKEDNNSGTNNDTISVVPKK
ncbi:ATP-dependent zinc metalloprotease FtsH [Spiroplasma endosymbiont of Polydrusus pterygomalis]|uniref:ATP-dependent zinc metalloprotease FtsH n=1 Tax=Spiroplasma endosymbiont of Polydrusus pterygomalis TaxID=3139327 RepID=UPI003CCA9721